jgi:hypothetical protein
MNLGRRIMKKDKDYIHWNLWRLSIDWFTDSGDWFLYFRYWNPNNEFKGYNYKVFEIKFSSSGFMNSINYMNDRIKH